MFKDSRILLGAAAVAAMLLSGPAAMAREAGDIIGRIGLTNVDPKQDNGTLDAVPVQVDVDDDTQVGVTGVYMITDNLAVELLASLPFEHDVSVNGIQVGSTKHLPPTLSLQWHFNTDGEVIPYIGAGLNYTTFFSEDGNGADPGLGVGVTDFELDDSFGIAVQAGLDFMISERTMINFDVRWADIDADLDSISLSDGSKVSNVGEVEIDPVIITLALGYKF